MKKNLDEKLFENLPILNQGVNKPKARTLEEQSQKQLEKLAVHPESRGTWKKYVKANELAEAEEKKLMQFAIERSTQKVNGYPKKDYSKPKTRLETDSERIERITYEFGKNNKKPAHYDNPNIIDYDNRMKPPKPYRPDDKSSYPSNRNQKQRLNSWELMLATAKSPQEKRELRDILNKDYKKTRGKYMSPKELRMINKHPDQLKKYEVPIITPTPVPYIAAAVQPEISVEEQIRRNADQKLRQEQVDHDMQYGRGGLAALSRPK